MFRSLVPFKMGLGVSFPLVIGKGPVPRPPKRPYPLKPPRRPPKNLRPNIPLRNPLNLPFLNLNPSIDKTRNTKVKINNAIRILINQTMINDQKHHIYSVGTLRGCVDFSRQKLRFVDRQKRSCFGQKSDNFVHMTSKYVKLVTMKSIRVKFFRIL